MKKEGSISPNGIWKKIIIVRLLRNCGYSIASLNKALAAEATGKQPASLPAKPSEILKFPELDSDISYVTDQYLDFLRNHKERAETIIGLISDYFRLYGEVTRRSL